MSQDQRLKTIDSRLNWSVIGVGFAGRARAKAIVSDPRASLVGVWRGRFAEEAGVTCFTSLEEAISAADAVAVCSPTAAHAEQIKQILDSNRHVLVEFPLAEDTKTAEALFARARATGKILHEEHIELLDATCATLQAHIRPSIVRTVSVAFEGPGRGDASPRDLALANVARLQRVVAFAGPFAELIRTEHEPGKLTAEMRLEAGGTVKAVFQMGPYFQRHTVIDADTVAGRWTQRDDQLLREGMPVTLVGTGGLFSRDQRACTARILDNVPHYVEESRILHVMDLVDCLAQGTQSALSKRFSRND